MDITAAQVQELRRISGAGMMDCKKALQECNGEMEKALEYLRKKGLADLKKKSGRGADEGIVDAYIHQGGGLGVLVEVDCETDFVARSETFQKFAHDIAMQIAAADPLYISREDVPGEVLEKEREIYKQQAKEEGKPDKVIDKIVSGKIEKYYQSSCLLEQSFIKDDSITVEKHLGDIAGKLGENIVIRRFTRYKIG